MPIKIQPIFQGALTEDTIMPWGSEYKKGAPIAAQATIISKKLEEFIITPPHPVSIYLSAAEKHVNRAIELEKDLLAVKKYIVYSHLNNDPNATAENSLRNDPNAFQLRQHDNEKLYGYLQESMSAIIHMIAAIETNVNLLIPTDFVYFERRFLIFKKKYDKAAIERYLSLEKKIMLISDQKGLKDLKQQGFWSDFKKVKRLRNNIIHSKTKGKHLGMGEVYSEIYSVIFDMDFEKILNSISSFIKFLDSDSKYSE